MMDMIPLRSRAAGGRTPALALLACACACACSSETVDLGELTRDFSSASRCQESASIEGSVVVENQDQLDALLGCEQIEGNLYIRPFEGADLTPLAALSRVAGVLDIGRFTVLDMFELPLEVQQRIGEIYEQEIALHDSGWLTSLAGLEGLERAGRLLLRGVGAESLAPLSNLSMLTDGGSLTLGPCTNLTDLSGLDNLEGITELDVRCDSLVSLAGPRFATRMGDVVISGASLNDLGNFAPESVRDLSIQTTALQNLDALSRLARAAKVDIHENPSLTNADALSTLNLADGLRIASNPALVSLPELTALVEIDALVIMNNDSLTNFPTMPNLGLLGYTDDEWGNLGPETVFYFRPDMVEVTGNPSLETIVMPPGWFAVGYLTIAANESLTSVDLGKLHAADGLYISTNPRLASVSLGELETADDLRVIDNPLLPLEPFEAVPSYSRIVQAGPLTPEQLAAP